jgi:recombination protein RecA
VKVVKNKMAPPFREVEFDILYGKGVSRSGEVIDHATDLGLVQKSGAWYSLGTERIGQGRDNARQYLEEHPDMLEKLAKQVMAKSGVGVQPPSGDAKPSDGKPEAAEGKQAPAGAAPADGEDDKKGKGGQRAARIN